MNHLRVDKLGARETSSKVIYFAIFPTSVEWKFTGRDSQRLALLSFKVGVEIGQIGFVVLILLLERAFRVLEIRWPRMVEALPGYAVGSLGAFWTIQRVAMLIGVVR
jgi:hypothetical protein